MPKGKVPRARSPISTPESPRKTPKKDEFSSPRKVDRAERSSSRENGQSPSPIRRPKPKFNLEEKLVASGDSGNLNTSEIEYENPGSPPVFEGLVKLKSKKVKQENSDDRDFETPKPVKKEKKTVKKEIKKEAVDSPHKIYLKKTKGEKKREKEEKKKKPKKKTKKVEEFDDLIYNGGSRITDFFEVRRSSRKPAKQLENERNALWRKLLREECTDGLEVREVPLKGRGVFNSKTFHKDDFVVEYSGDLIDPKEAQKRDDMYSKNTDKYGSYMYYFIHKGTKWCIDATIESGKLGRLLNHSCKVPNCATKIIEVNDLPRLVIYAKQEIAPDNELLYDYGDRGKVSLEAHPWLKD